MTRKRKDYRELKVSSFSGYGYKSAPMLRIQGLWLEELGFNIGDPILVKCEDGKLIITVDHAREDAETKEQAFLDEEMKKLQKKFEVEKKKIYQQVVAERKVRYTGHYWYLHCTGYPTEGTCIIFHKHRFNHPYHQHGRARTLHQAVKNIKGHDEWQMNGKHR